MIVVGDRVRFLTGSRRVTGDVLAVHSTHLVVRVLEMQSGRLRAFRFFVQPNRAEKVVAS